MVRVSMGKKNKKTKTYQDEASLEEEYPSHEEVLFFYWVFFIQESN